MSSEPVERRLTAILAADVAGYSRLIGANEEGTLAQLKAFRKTLVDPTIAKHRGRIVKTTGDGLLVEFASAVDAARCAVEVQRGMADENTEIPQAKRIEFRIGIHLGDVIIDDNDIFGDGVNIAARLESIAVPGGISISRAVHDQVRDRINVCFDDKGEIALKNIARPVHVFAISGAKESKTTVSPESKPALALPDKPSIAVLPFTNMSGDPEQDFFADGMVEEIITALSHFKALFVIARNSSFTYKGRAVDVKQVGRELGVRYVLEGSVRKAANRVRITGQLVDTATGAHLWADRIDGGLGDIFDLQDQVTESVVGAIAPVVEKAEIERARRKPTDSLDAYTPWVHDTSATPARVLWRWDNVMASSASKSELRSTACMQAVDLKTKLLLRSTGRHRRSVGNCGATPGQPRSGRGATSLSGPSNWPNADAGGMAASSWRASRTCGTAWAIALRWDIPPSRSLADWRWNMVASSSATS